MRGTNHARPCQASAARPKPGRQARPPSDPERPIPNHPSPAAPCATTKSLVVAPCPAKHHVQAAKKAATQSSTTARPRTRTDNSTQTSETSTAHGLGPQPLAGRQPASPCAGIFYEFLTESSPLLDE